MSAADVRRLGRVQQSVPNGLLPIVRKLHTQSGLSDIERETLLALPSRIASLDRYAHLLHEGDSATSFCALLNGFAFGQKNTGTGARQIFAIHMQGDIMDLTNGSGPSDYGVQALTPVTVGYIPKNALLKAATDHPGIAAALWADVRGDASIAREWLLNIGRRTARQRISHLFCELAVRETAIGIHDDAGCVIRLTQQQIGDATGLTAVHVNRTIQRLRTDGLIRIRSQRMSIVDWVALEAAGDFNRAYLQPSVAGNVRIEPANGR